MKRVHKPETRVEEEESATQAQTQPQPEEEPPEEPQGRDEGDAAFVQEDEVFEEALEEEEHMIRDPPIKRPTLEEYQVKWKTLLEKHSKAVPGDFGKDNLVPSPVHVL